MPSPGAPKPTSARLRAVSWLVAGSALVLAAFLVLSRSRSAELVSPAPSRLEQPLSLVPPGPAFVLTLDLSRLRETPAGKALLGKGLAELSGRTKDAPFRDCLPKLSQELDRIAVAIPATEGFVSGANGPEAGAFGLIAAGRFRADTVMQCAAQGGKAEPKRTLVRTKIGAFDTLRDPKGAGELAARNGLLVLSGGSYFRDVLDRANRAEGLARDAPEVEQARDRLHAELRRTVGKDAPLVVTLVLSPGWLEKAVRDPEAERSPLAAIRSVGLRASLSNDLDVSALLACEREDACERLERFLVAARSDLGALVSPAAAALLARFTHSRKGAALELTGKLPLSELEKLLASVPAPPASAAP